MKSWHTLLMLIGFSTCYSEVQLLDNDFQIDKSSINREDEIKSKNVANQTVQTDQTEQSHRISKVQNKTKKVHAILELTLGNPQYNIDETRIDIYVAPTCLHCCKLIVEELQSFLNQNSSKCFIRIILLPTSAKDLFVMKLIQSEAKDVNGYYMIYTNYVKRAYATINSIKPTEEQKRIYKGSVSDPEMIKFQAIASAFGFSDEKIVMAYPNMDDDYEVAVMNWYKNVVETIRKFCPSKELDLPLIVQNGKRYISLNDVRIPN